MNALSRPSPASPSPPAPAPSGASHNHTKASRNILLLVTIVNFISYGWWTILNKSQFSIGPDFVHQQARAPVIVQTNDGGVAQESGAQVLIRGPPAPPLLSTTCQMIFASVIAVAVLIVRTYSIELRKAKKIPLSNEEVNGPMTVKVGREGLLLSVNSTAEESNAVAAKDTAHLPNNAEQEQYSARSVGGDGGGGGVPTDVFADGSNFGGGDREEAKLRAQGRTMALAILTLRRRWAVTRVGFCGRIVPLGLSRAVDIGGGNVALALVSVALQQTIKSTLPVFVTVLTVLWLRSPVRLSVWISLLPIMIGTLLAISDRGGTHSSSNSHLHTYNKLQKSNVEDSEDESMALLGIVLAFLSCFGRAAKAVINHRLLQRNNSCSSAKREQQQQQQRLRPLEIVIYEAPTTACILLLPALYIEHAAIQNIIAQPYLNDWIMWWLKRNVFAGLCMFVTQLAYVSIIDYTSALTCQVLMNIKMLLLVFGSVAYFQLPYTARNVVGVLLAVGGCMGYAYASSNGSSTAGEGQSMLQRGMMASARLWLWLRRYFVVRRSLAHPTRAAV